MLCRLVAAAALVLFPTTLSAECSIGDGCETEKDESFSVSLLQHNLEVALAVQPEASSATPQQQQQHQQQQHQQQQQQQPQHQHQHNLEVASAVKPDASAATKWEDLNDGRGAKANALAKMKAHGRWNSHGQALHSPPKVKSLTGVLPPRNDHFAGIETDVLPPRKDSFAGIEAGSNGAVAKSRDKKLLSRTKLYENPEICALVGALGVAMMTFGAVSIRRSKREAEEIKDMESKEHTAEALLDLSRRGEDLPSVCIIKGVLSSTGENVKAASPHIPGLSDKVGTIEQPKNALIEIARAVKKGDDDGKFSSIIEKQTGLKPEDIPDVEDDFTSRKVDFKHSGCILSEILIQRLFVFTSKKETKPQSQGRGRGRGRPGSSSSQAKIEIDRNPRQLSYNVFHARNISAGLHLTDLKGKKIELQLPDADTVKQVSIGEPPSMFLATADTSTELLNYIRRDGLTVKGKHVDLSKMPPTTVGDPLTMLNKFIFLDVQSDTDLGSMGQNKQVLDSLPAAYSVSTSGQFLWEPKGFYDQDKQGKFFNGATLTKRELVSSEELVRRARQAAEENSRTTGHCEPTFSRQELPRLRDKENCFRYTELAIPQDSAVTILAKPVKAGDGIRLVPPNCAENGRDAADPDAERYRFSIVSGYSVENLLKQRELNIMQYYGIACVGAFATTYAAAGCPGM